MPVAATPFLIVPITVRLAAVAGTEGGGFGCAPGGAVAGRRLTTVEVLPSLVSLLPLARSADRVAGLDGGAAAVATVAPRFLLAAAAVVPLVVLVVVLLLLVEVPVVAVEAVVVLRVVAATRMDRAFSTMLLRMFVATIALPGVTTGRAMPDLAGVATVRLPGVMRLLEVVGDRTWPG